MRGYKEEGTTTTPFDMVVLNDLDRYHLVMDVIDRVPGLASRAGHVRQLMRDRRSEHKAYIVEHGDDQPEVRDWKWPGLRLDRRVGIVRWGGGYTKSLAATFVPTHGNIIAGQTGCAPAPLTGERVHVPSDEVAVATVRSTSTRRATRS